MNFGGMICVNGTWFDVGQMAYAKQGQVYLDMSAKDTTRCSRDHTSEQHHPVTPIPDSDPRVIAMNLGLAAYESVPEELRERVTGEYRATKVGAFEPHINQHGGSEFSYPDAAAGVTWDSSPRIILSPPPEPQKTDRDWLEGIVEVFEAAKKSESNTSVSMAVFAAKRHLEKTQNEPE